jgi:hypothetical protein
MIGDMSNIRTQLNAEGARLYDQVMMVYPVRSIDPLGQYGKILFRDRADDLKFRSFIHEAARRAGRPVGVPGWSRWSEQQALTAGNDEAVQKCAWELVAMWADPDTAGTKARRYAYVQARRTSWKSMCYGAILAGVFIYAESFIIGPNYELMFRIFGLIFVVVGCLPFGVVAFAGRSHRSSV